MGKTIIHGKFEWDADKAEANIKNHGIGFEEILPIFDDPLFWEQYDTIHSSAEETRYLGTGRINNFTVVISGYTDGKRIRIISAGISTGEEEKRYEKWCSQFYS
ncbi:BrnT family toxin [Treponema parvum]|uniref:BrnT family toxin n=1 Tax=Treponema parvum TaxID=138851 RepID=A0A975F4Q3_9SPIR|nr:BrnT family toxin [Treponema parvum]QTQ14365.1 BrnT family toxin [Treponema parvum]